MPNTEVAVKFLNDDRALEGQMERVLAASQLLNYDASTLSAISSAGKKWERNTCLSDL